MRHLPPPVHLVKVVDIQTRPGLLGQYNLQTRHLALQQVDLGLQLLVLVLELLGCGGLAGFLGRAGGSVD